jgi:FkbH-like protein
MLEVEPTLAADFAALLDRLPELRCTTETCSKLEQSAASLSPEEARESIARLSGNSSEAALWLLGCLHMHLQNFRAAADCWRHLWWAVEGDGRTTILLSSAKALLHDSRPDEAWYPLAQAIRRTRSARILRQAERLLKQASKAGSIPSKRTCRIALVSSFNIDLLIPILRAQCFGEGIDAAIYSGAYNQVVQEIESSDSRLAAFQPDVVVLATDWRWLGLADEEIDPAAALDQRIEQLQRLWSTCRTRWNAYVLQFDFEVPGDEPWGRLSMSLPGGRARLLQSMNLKLWEMAEHSPGVAMVDVDQTAAGYGKQRWSDPVLWEIAKQYPAADAMPELGHSITAAVRAAYGLTMKCIALDLDGTLWGGVIGEDGLNGIQLGGTAAGEAYVGFQRYLKSVSQQGTLLAVCSKNNDEDARLPFRSHRDMVLKESDIACFVANWETKQDNLRTIAQTINIGLDSIVFVDDNPAERARMRQKFPEVEVVELPADPAGFIRALAAPRFFEKSSLTAEDRARTESIRQNVERTQLAATAGNVDEYLAGLGIKVHLAPFDDSNLTRVVQLINKTNQFNVTTRRRTDAEVRALLSDGCYTQAMRVSDRYGDSGLTGVLIAVPENGQLRLDTWLMSCRVMGRRLEEAMFAALARYAQRNNFGSILCEFIPTAKNVVVEDLFDRLGCISLGERDGVRQYRWPLEQPFATPGVLECVDDTEIH